MGTPAYPARYSEFRVPPRTASHISIGSWQVESCSPIPQHCLSRTDRHTHVLPILFGPHRFRNHAALHRALHIVRVKKRSQRKHSVVATCPPGAHDHHPQTEAHVECSPDSNSKRGSGSETILHYPHGGSDTSVPYHSCFCPPMRSAGVHIAIRYASESPRPVAHPKGPAFLRPQIRMSRRYPGVSQLGNLRACSLPLSW